jgi:hypothetical protein
MDTRKLQVLTEKIKEIEYTIKMMEKSDPPSHCKVQVLAANEHKGEPLYWHRWLDINPVFVREALQAQIRDIKEKIKENL